MKRSRLRVKQRMPAAFYHERLGVILVMVETTVVNRTCAETRLFYYQQPAHDPAYTEQVAVHLKHYWRSAPPRFSLN